MGNGSVKTAGLRAATVAWVAAVAICVAGCSGEISAVDRAQAQVTAKEKAVAQAEADFQAASATFCETGKTYILALDRYGDVLNDTAPTVGDVREAGADLTEPRDEAFEGAEAAVAAQQDLADAQAELVSAQAALERAEAGATDSPSEPATEPTTMAPLAPTATVDRVKQADSEFAAAQGAVTDDTPLAAASEQFNSAAVALEMAWLQLYADAGCVPEGQQEAATAAVRAYTSALQQSLADAGYYDSAIDGVYGPSTVAAVEALQAANGLAVTGTVDKATADALQAELMALGGVAAQETVATTAAVQQTLKLAGYWDGPVDGNWTPALTEALKEFQIALGVEPTGSVDAATIAAFEKALAELQAPDPSESPSPEPSESEEP